jgi:phospholipase A2-like protein
MIGFKPSRTRRTSAATFAAVALLAGGASVAATPAGATGPSLHGCPYGAVCVYPQNRGLNGGHPEPGGVYFSYGAHNLRNQLGNHTVVNNQYAGAVYRLCFGYGGSQCGRLVPPGRTVTYDLSPINSIVLAPAPRPAAPVHHPKPKPKPKPPVNLRAEADRIMRMTYDQFADFSRLHLKPFDWSTDGCSGPKFTKRVYKDLFDKPCRLHDFGYRNYGRGLHLGRNETTRAWIDLRFKQEMDRRCNHFTGWQSYKGVVCRSEAHAIYLFERKTGNLVSLGVKGFYG